MNKKFQVFASIFVMCCAAYGAYTLVNKFLLARKKLKESNEFDDLYNEYVATHEE